jgi:hypothetical protein
VAAQDGHHGRRLLEGHEHIDVDVLRGPGLGVIGEGKGSSERVGHLEVVEEAIDANQ